MEDKKRKLLRLNIQHFADPGGGDPQEPQEPNEPQEPQEPQEPNDKTYTQSELDSQVSKAVESALKKREAKMQEELEKRIEKERNEAAEYAKLTQKEQEEADYKKRMEELERREQEINNRELKAQVESDLKENNLPLTLADTLVSVQDNEKIKGKIADIKKEFDDAVNERVKEALRQETPTQSTKELADDPFTAKLAKYK